MFSILESRMVSSAIRIISGFRLKRLGLKLVDIDHHCKNNLKIIELSKAAYNMYFCRCLEPKLFISDVTTVSPLF